MDELVQIDNPTPAKPNPAENMTDDQLLAAIQQAQGGPVNTELNVAPASTEQPGTPSLPAGTESQATPPAPATEQPPAPSVPTDAPATQAVEPGTEKPATFEQIAEKKHIQSPDELASMYANLEREFHKKNQELSTLRKQEAPQPVAPTQPSPADINEWVRQNFASDPVGTLYAVNQMMMKPVMETQRDIEFRNELTRLSSSPKTADFNLKPVQDEIQKVIQERPQKYLDPVSGKVKASELEDLYYIARGRIGTPSNVARPVSQPVNKVVPAEGASKPAPIKQFDPLTAPLDELRAKINEIERNNR